jgi:hypothetical protein
MTCCSSRAKNSSLSVSTKLRVNTVLVAYAVDGIANQADRPGFEGMHVQARILTMKRPIRGTRSKTARRPVEDPAAVPCELSDTPEERDEPPCDDGQTLEKRSDVPTWTHTCALSVVIGISRDCTEHAGTPLPPLFGCVTCCCSWVTNSRLSTSIWLRVMLFSSLMQ